MPTRRVDRDGRVCIMLTARECRRMTLRLFGTGENMEEDHEHNVLLRNIKSNLDEFRVVQTNVSSEWGASDLFYRFYHQSFKVYRLQEYTVSMRDLFLSVGPGDGSCVLNKTYAEIVNAGTGTEFDLSHNDEWGRHTRPILEAYFHSKMFLDMMISCGERLETAANLFPSDWAAVLYLYNMR